MSDSKTRFKKQGNGELEFARGKNTFGFKRRRELLLARRVIVFGSGQGVFQYLRKNDLGAGEEPSGAVYLNTRFGDSVA